MDDMIAQRTEAWIGLGSNLDNPQQQLELALATLRQLAVDDSLQCSSFYLSKALVADGTNEENGQQPDYINAVARLETMLAPHELLVQLQSIEMLQGRIRHESAPRWSPRTLDLDILLYGDLQLNTPALTLPHAGIRLREFVLYPMYELAPTLEIPVLGALEKLVKHCPMRGMRLLNGNEEGSTVAITS